MLKLAIAIFTDLALLASGVAFDFPFLLVFPPTAVLLIPGMFALIVLRRFPRFKKSFILNAAFFIFTIFTIDVIVLMQDAFYGWNPWLMAAAPLAYVAALRFRKHRLLQWDRVQALIVPLVITAMITIIGDSPQSPDACKRIPSSPGVRLIHEFPTKTRVRFVLQLKGTKNLLVSFRKGFMVPQPNYTPRTLELINPATGETKSWLSRGEVIGLYQRADTSEIYAVLIEPMPDKSRGESYLDLVIFAPSGRVLRRVPMPNARSDYYIANVFPQGNKFIIFVEGNIYTFDPAANKIELARFYKDFTPYYMLQSGNDLIGVVCKSPLIMFTAPAALMKFDLRTLTLTGKRYGGPFGYYEVRELDSSGTFAASTVWGGGGLLFDKNLRAIKKLHIPRGVRNFGIDPSGKYLFAPNSFSGMMQILDTRSNHLLKAEYFVGKGARSLNDTADGKIIIGNSCGLVEIDPKRIVTDAINKESRK